MSNWAWVLYIGAVTLAAASFVLWQAFKHLDLKIERLGERLGDKIERLDLKIDKKLDDQRNYFDKKLDDQRNHFDHKLDQRFDQLADGIAELSRLVAGYGEQVKVQGAQVKAQKKQIDLLSGAVFASPRFDAPGQHQEGAPAPSPAAPAEPAAPGEGIASSADDPEPTPPTAAIAPA